MKISLYGLFVVLGLALGFAVGSLNAAAQELSMNEIKSLPGYKSYGTLSSFTKHLQEDPVLYRALSSNQQLSEKIMGSTTLQRKLLSDIKKSGDSQSVLSRYEREFNKSGELKGSALHSTYSHKGHAPDQKPLQKDNDAEKGAQNNNANLAAQRAIEQARNIKKEAAEKHAKAQLVDAQALLDKDAQQPEFEAEMLQYKVVQDIVKQLTHDPAALDEFFADTRMIQKLMDKEITVEEAMDKLGVVAKSAQKPTSTRPPEPAGSSLVHVQGSKYTLDGKAIYDLNHVPGEDEMALDAGGWPKFLHVPEECTPANPAITYFFESRYGLGKGKSPAASGAMNMLASKSLIYQTGKDIGLTDSEQLAAPFVTPNKVVRHDTQNPVHFDIDQIFLPDGHSMVGNGFFNVSVSYCPSDWARTTPANQPELAEACSFTYTEFVTNAANHLKIKVQNTDETVGEVNPDIKNKTICSLEPGKRYFFNLAPRHHIESDKPTQKQAMLDVFERNKRYDPDAYTLTPEKHFEAYLSKPGIGTRNGEFVATTSGYQYGRGLELYNSLPPLPNKQPRFSGLIDEPTLASEGNFYAVSTKSMPRQPDEAYLCTGKAGQVILDKTCKDPEGNLPPQRVAKKCVSDTKSVWLEGYGEPMYSVYVCKDTVK